MVRQELKVCGKRTTEVTCYSHHVISRSCPVNTTWLFTADADLDHLAEVCVWFLHCRVLFNYFYLVYSVCTTKITSGFTAFYVYSFESDQFCGLLDHRWLIGNKTYLLRTELGRKVGSTCPALSWVTHTMIPQHIKITVFLLHLGRTSELL